MGRGKRIDLYTPEQHAWIRERYADMTNRELAEAFNAEFGTDRATQEAMRAYGSNKRLRKAPGVRERALSKYTPEMLDWLRAYIPGHHEQEIIDAFDAEFGMRLTTSMVANLKQKLGVKSGTVGGQFQKGSVPANKGRRWDDYMSPEAQANSRATCFKPGQLSGIAAEIKRPLLDVRETKDGYLQIKVAPRNAKHPMQNWLSLAEYEWMRANGREWPDNHRPVFADRDTRNFAPDNIVPVPEDIYALVTGGMRGYGIAWHDRQTLEVAMAHAQVVRARRQLECHERECTACGRTFSPDYPHQARCRECIDLGKKGPRRRGERHCLATTQTSE